MASWNGVENECCNTIQRAIPPASLIPQDKGSRSDVDEIQDNQNAQKQSYADKRECTLHRKSVDRFYREVFLTTYN